MTLTEYLATSYRPDCEYLDGELLERNAGEWDHSRLQMLLSRYICNREKQWGILVALASACAGEGHAFPCARYLSFGRATACRSDHRGTSIFVYRDLVSFSDRMKEMQERIDDYLSFGVRYVWLLHPRTRRAFVYTLDAVREVKDGMLRTNDPDICVPLAELE